MNFFRQIRLIAAGLFLSFSVANLVAQTAGFNNTFAILSINGGANAYYDLNATTANTDFNGNNLGTFNPASNSLTMKGAEHNVWKCGGCDLTSSRLMYRIYPTSTPTGSFISMNVPYTSGFANGCGGQDQMWSVTGNSVNVLSGLAPGNYTLEVYSEASVTCSGGTVYASNLSANYKATFTVGGSPVVVTATTGNVGPTVYATLGAAFTAINAGTHTGTINVRITGNTTETVTCTLNASGSGSASYTAISIQPSGGGARTVSGAIAAGSPLIDLNGADNVTIDGLNTGGNSLTISNSTVGSTFTIRFIGDAIGNTITNCSVLGSSTGTATTNSGTIFFSTSTTNGNDNNTISNCNIGPVGSNLPSKAIYSNGSTTNATRANSGISITGNNIYDYYLSGAHAAIYANDGNTDWTISNNKFYQTATRTFSASTGSAIFINGSTTANNNNLISGNTIGFSNSSGTGTYTLVFVSGSSFIPINIAAAGTTTATSVQGNTIAGIAISGAGSGTSTSAPFRAIYVGGGLTTIGNVTGNTIGSLTATGSITYTSSSASSSDVIGIFNFGSSNWTTSNNNIGGFTVANSSTGATNFYGLRCNTGSAVTWTCTGNTIGGSVANSISSTSTATGTIVNGILNSNPIGSFSNNIVRNMSVAGGTGTTTTASIVGICMNSTANQTISQNQIFNLSNTNTTASTIVTGIQFTGSTANIVERNLIYGLTSSTNSATAEVNGIRVAGGTTTYRNNMIAIGNGITNALGAVASNSSASGINGFNGALGTDNFWNNSIFIGGTATAGSGASYAFNGTQTINSRSFRNNVFVNARTNSGASGKNYAIKINGTAANPAGLTINNNVYFTSGTGGVFGYFNSGDIANLAAWKVALGQDAGSFEGNPQFVDPTNTTPDLHINSNNSTNTEAAGFDLGVTTDYDGQTRSGLTPVDIGADAFIAVVTCASTPSPTSGTTNVVLSPTLSWAAATNAAGYDVYLGTTSGSLTLVSTNQVGLSYTPSSALSPSTQYFWRIVPRNGSNYASGCTEWSFTTQAASPTLSSTSLTAFSNQCINTTSTANSFNLSGVYLTTANITVGPLAGFSFSSTSNGTYTSTLTITQPGGTLASTPVFVQFTPTSASSFNGNIPVSGGGLSSAISVAVTATGVNTPATASTGVSSSITPTTATIAGSYIANCQTITAYGVEYSTTNGFANGTGTQVTSTNQSSGSFTSSLTGLANNTTYYYKSFAIYGATTVYGTQSTFTTPQVCNIALQETFSTVTTPTGWGLTNFTITSAISGVPAAFTSNYARVNLWSSTTSANFTTCNYGPVGANANLTFNYSVTNYGTPYAAPAAGWGNIQVQISTDFGLTYSTINTITTSSNAQTPVSISLASYAGQYAKFKFIGTWTTGDYNVVIDDINAIAPCVAPTQPTNLTFTNVGPAQMTINYSASTSSTSGYMIVRYPAGDSPTTPTDGTTYTAGTALGTGTVDYVGTNLSNIISGLSVNTTYDFYVYPYNAVTCANGPVYNTTSPLSGSQSTTGCPTLSSVITIGAGYDYATLTDAIVILNGCGITQPTVLELQSNYVSTSEAFPISLGSISGASAANTITIRPASGVSSALAITSSNATGTISHNQGSNFIFDGRPGGAGTNKFITIENTSTSGYAINYQNESSNNVLRYLTLKSQNTSTSSGTIVFSTTTGANGNDNNTVEYNDICAVNASSATPTNAIYAAGSAATSASNNSNNVVSNNTIRDFYNSTSTTNAGSGVNIVTGNTDWTISNNSIFQTQTRNTFGAAAPFYAIFINNTSGNNFNVSSNIIGGTAINAGGSALTINASTTALMRLVYLSVGTTTATNVSSNTIKNISFTTTSASTVNGLISVLNGAVNCTNNILGDVSVSNSILFNTSGASAMFSGIMAGTGATGQGAINITGNTIAGLAVGGGGTCELRGVSFQSSGIIASTQYTVSNNIIGSTSVTNSLSNSNNSAVYGIIGTASQTTSTNTISANTIAGIQSTSTGANASIYGILAQGSTGGKYSSTGNSISKLQSSGGSIVTGIYHTAATTNDQVIGANNVSELAHTGTGTASVLGIYYSGPTAGTNEIKSNSVHSLSATTAGSTLTGIQVADAGNALIYNNMIRLGINAAGSAVTTNVLVYGINQSGATSNHSIYFNSIYVGGTGVLTGTNNTFALHSAATSGTRNIRNNIFSNERANGAGTGKHYGIRLAGLTGLTINNNDYWTGASFLALNNATDVTAFASWQTATSQDAGSLSNNPNFVNPTGSSSTFDLHINNATSSVLESGGVNVPGITTDIDGNTRPGPTGSSNGGGISSDIGADEFDGIPGYTCSTFPSLTAATTNATVCGGSTATLSITGTISGTGVTYQWQSASTQTGTYSNIVGATGATYIVPVSSASNLWYICQVTCANGPLTSSTSAVNVQVLACNYTTSRNTGITYSSIMNTGSTYSSITGTTPADDGYTNAVSLTGTTFKYRGSAITGFVATTNGWMTFNTASTSNTWTNDLTSSTNNNVLAPLWEDLVIKGADIANKDISMRYQVIGTLGSGTADIVIEWAEMERFNYGDPNVNFQVVLHEADNSIDYNYGNFQMFNGATNPSTTTWTYSIGMNGPTPATNSTDQRIILQAENSNFFSSTLQNSLGYSIECNSQYRFVPSLTFGSGSAPTSGSYTASTYVPLNNETAGAITIPVNGSPCVSYCGIIYSSKNATASSGISACSAASPGTADDDVFFKFNTSTLTNYRIAVDPSAGYNAVVQVLDASLTPVTCVNVAGAGLSELITSVSLNPSSLYYIRVYDAATGATNNGEFSICISEVIAPPVNDEPSGAIALTSGITCSGTSSILPSTLSATATSGVTSCSAGTPGTADDDIWYSFTTNSISGTTYAITATGVSTYNAVLQLYSGTVGNLVSVNCVNATGNGGVETINAGSLSTNTTYYLRVYHSGTGAANGNVSICVVHTLPTCLTSATTNVNDYVWQGQSTDWNAASNWLIYNGPTSYTVATSVPSSVDVVIPSSTCFSNQPVVVTTPSTVNNLTVLSGATLAVGSNTLSITGNLTVSGTLSSGTGVINFTGNGTQLVSIGNQSFNHVTINGFGTVQLTGNTTISGNYTNNSGSLDLNNFNLTMGGNYSNYVANTGFADGLIPGTGSVIFNKASGTQTVDQLALDFFTVRHTGAGTLQLLSDLSTTGNIVNTAGIIDGNGKIITTKGNFNNTATFNAGNGGQIIFEKNGGNQTLTAGTAVFEKLIHQVPFGGASATLTLSGTVDVKGDVVIDAPIIAGTSTLKLSGTGNQTMSGTESVIALNSLTVEKATGNVTLSKPVRVDGALTMTQGNIITSSSNKLEIGSSTSALGSVNWTSGNVVGPMRRWFAGATNSTAASGMFPVGLSTVNRYAQVNFTQAPGSGGYIEMEYKAGLPANAANWTYVTTPDGQLIQTFEDEGYWDITPYDASGNAYPSGLNTSAFTMKLRANGLTSVNDISVTRIIRSPGPDHTTWEPAGFHLASTGTTSDFAIESNTVTGFSWFNIGSPSNNPLPVELLNFNGTCNEGMVNLTWQTASEFNSSHFDVEKSTDGETWRVLATIPSAGTSNELLTYQAMDNSGTNGSNYYRLRQVDNDGKEKLYDPINVSCVESTAGYFTSYPNPSGNEFQVVVNNKEILGACTLNIVDVHGKVIDQRSIDMKEGINMFVITEMLKPGIYFLNITNGTKSTQVIKHAVK